MQLFEIFQIFFLIFLHQYSKIHVCPMNLLQNDVLKNYITSIKYNTSTSFDDIENDLSNYIYEIIGFIKAKMTINNEFDIELLKPHLKQIESANKIKFLLFDTRDYSVLFGDEILENLIELTNSENKTEK